MVDTWVAPYNVLFFLFSVLLLISFKLVIWKYKNNKNHFLTFFFIEDYVWMVLNWGLRNENKYSDPRFFYFFIFCLKENDSL